MQELSVVQKTHDFIKWYVPILNRLPKDHKFQLGSRTIERIYELLEGLIEAKYAKSKLAKLESLNISLSVLRHQTRLLQEFDLISLQRFEYANRAMQEIGNELGGWIEQRKRSSESEAIRKPILANN